MYGEMTFRNHQANSEGHLERNIIIRSDIGSAIYTRMRFIS